MKIGELHGEIACFGLTGDVNGNLNVPIEAEGLDGNGIWWLDDTQWAYSTRKDGNGNGGRYAFGYTGNPSQTAEFYPRTIDGTLKEGWIRWCEHALTSSGWNFQMVITGLANGGFRQHVRVDIQSGTSDKIYLYANNVLADSIPPSHPGIANEWSVYEVGFRIDDVDGYVRVYKDFNYSAPILEFVGDTRDNGDGNPNHVNRIHMYINNTHHALDDCKIQNLTIGDPYESSSPWVPSNVAFLQVNTIGEQVDFYDRASAVSASTKLTVVQHPLSTAVPTIVIDGQGLFAVSGAVTPGNNEFSIDQIPDGNGGGGGASTSIDDIAQNIADAINLAANFFADPEGNYGMFATAVGGATGEVIITLDALGAVGNGAPLVNNFTGIDITDTGNFGSQSTGVDGTQVGEATIWNHGNGEHFRRSFFEIFRLIEHPSMNEWDGLDPTSVITNAYARPHDGVNVTTGYMVLRNNTLDIDSGYCGDGYFHEALSPNAVGSFTNQSRGGVDTGNNYDQVNDGVRADSETSYVYTPNVNVIDAYGMTNFPIADGQIDRIVGLSIFARVQKVSEAAAEFNLLGLSGSTGFGVFQSEAVYPLATSWTVHVGGMEANPDTGLPWTQTTINALEIGQQFQDE
jgi:hypothetical protein